MSCPINNHVLLACLMEGSCLVIDPKSESLGMTAARRRHFARKVMFLDPWTEVAQQGATETPRKRGLDAPKVTAGTSARKVAKRTHASENAPSEAPAKQRRS